MRFSDLGANVSGSLMSQGQVDVASAVTLTVNGRKNSRFVVSS